MSLLRAVAISVALITLPAAADDYIDQKPLTEIVAPQVRECRTLDEIQIPLRTSGGDIITLYGNQYDTEASAGGPYQANGLNVCLVLENNVDDQLEAFLTCETPVMKASQSMVDMVADITEADRRTEMVGVFQYGWSNGGAVLVARPDIKRPVDLSGSMIVTQAYAPHLGYLARVLADARIGVKNEGGQWVEPTVRYTENLLGFDQGTPASAFLEDDDIDVAFVAKADADILTAGDIGTGAEGSVRGAHALLSTKSASRLISDALVVRRDYFEANTDQIKALVKATFEAEELLREDVVKQIVPWDDVAGVLLGDPGAIEQAKDLWRFYETVGLKGNVDWATDGQPRSFKAVNDDIQSYLVEAGLLAEAHELAVADWDFRAEFGDDIFDERMAELLAFDDNQASNAIDQLRETGDVAQSTLFTFEINFAPNQSTFTVVEYKDEFADVIDLASGYAGAVLTVEGHSDPLKYLKLQHEGAPAAELDRLRKSAENLSCRRASAVRDALITAADEQGFGMDASQFVISGIGIEEPGTGICGKDPCPPQTEAEWLSNMRVSFRLVNLESEAAVFTPPNDW